MGLCIAVMIGALGKESIDGKGKREVIMFEKSDGGGRHRAKPREFPCLVHYSFSNQINKLS